MSPGRKLRFQATGRCVPHGNAVRCPCSVGPSTVRLTATTAADAGTPARSAIGISSVDPNARVPIPDKTPSTVAPIARVWTIRCGAPEAPKDEVAGTDRFADLSATGEKAAHNSAAPAAREANRIHACTPEARW